MKKFLLALTMTTVLMCAFGILTVFAGTYGDLTYEITDGKVTITDCYFEAVTVVIPEEIEGYPVTKIGVKAFYECWVENLYIPESVTDIGENAFDVCSCLTKVSIQSLEAWCNINFENEKSNPLFYSGHLYFDDSEIGVLTIPKGVKEIKKYAFYNCRYFTSVSIPESVTTIGTNAFYDCIGLKRVDIKSLESWCNIDFANSFANPLYHAKELFLNYTLIETLDIPQGITEIKNYTFSNSDKITSINIPNTVTSIGIYAFDDCNKLANVDIAGGVKSIGDYAFYNCLKLKSISIPHTVTSIGEGAFFYCKGLTSIDIPDSVTTLGSNLFYDCNVLTDVTIGKGIKTIPNRTFYSCSTLKNITLPASILKIETEAFEHCNRLENIIFAGSETQWEDILISTGNEYLFSANISFGVVGKQPLEYSINSIEIKNMQGDLLPTIPTTNFKATVTVENVTSSKNAIIILASYTDKFKILTYTDIEDLAIGSTFKITLPVSNVNGDVKKIKVFVWDALSSMTPVSERVTYETE